MNGEGAVYLDSSALVKLVIGEPESAALREFLARHPRRASCGLARVEVPRAVKQHGVDALARARRLLARVQLLRLDDPLLDLAAELDTVVLRSLDAIHLAAAQALGIRLGALVSYDSRMVQAAESLGMATAAPN